MLPGVAVLSILSCTLIVCLIIIVVAAWHCGSWDRPGYPQTHRDLCLRS